MKKPYPLEAADKINDFVRKMGYCKKLSPTAKNIYFFGMPELERRITGLCQPTTTTYDDISKYSNVSRPTIRAALLQLQAEGLCIIDIGSPEHDAKKATRFQRLQIEELQQNGPYKALVEERPRAAVELQKLLTTRTFVYEHKPLAQEWSVNLTGRLYSKKGKAAINVQQLPKDVRVKGLMTGLVGDEVLFDIDYKQAEPTVIQHALGFDFGCDPYEKLAKNLKIPREKAKILLNTLSYCAKPRWVLDQWKLPAARDFMMPYIDAMESFREKLWNDGIPSKGHPRFVKTLYGTIIKATPGQKTPNRGTLLSWYAQGAVADMLNHACLTVIKEEVNQRWRFLCPVHDAAYVIGRPEHKDALREIFQKEPVYKGLNIKVEIAVHGAEQTIASTVEPRVENSKQNINESATIADGKWIL